MTNSQEVRQYQVLFDLLSDYSRALCGEAREISESLGLGWNSKTAQFEVDVYFVFQLSASMRGLKHQREVWEEMMLFCESQLLSRYARPVLEADDLSDVIIARIERYGNAHNRSIESGQEPVTTGLKWLRQHLASGNGNKVVADPAFMIGDYFAEMRFIMAMVPVEMRVDGEFGCCLKHILQATSDVRTLSLERIKELVGAGSREAQQLAPKDIGHVRPTIEKVLSRLDEGEQQLAGQRLKSDN
ncbi:MAG: hypothetical protein IH830_03870 [Planctomycetes bacterium]|nr:hypothetical protein [Planctomycetota bacterium]